MVLGCDSDLELSVVQKTSPCIIGSVPDFSEVFPQVIITIVGYLE